MARSISTDGTKTLRLQVKALQQRVLWLESALRPKNSDANRVDLAAAGRQRDVAERQAKSRALDEYFKAKEVDRFTKDPWLREIRLGIEKERDDFLKSRGFKPEPSSVPKELRQLSRRVSPKRRKAGSES